MPLEIRRTQIAIIYWANIKGHNETHPPLNTLQPCQEKEKKQFDSFGWKIMNKIEDIGMNSCQISPRAGTRRRYHDDGISDEEIDGKRLFDLEEKVSSQRFGSDRVVRMEGKGRQTWWVLCL
uniref:Uncharacterized protein n=1 Tax=Kryptolebias marmoratus TaxID=37003 RepID=A0A3Q3BKC9_KRYMA